MGLLHLAAALGLPGADGAGPYVELARLAERGGLDFVTLDDTRGGSGLDASAVLGRMADATRHIGLVPPLTEPPTGTDADAGTVGGTGAEAAAPGRVGRRIDVSPGGVASGNLFVSPPAQGHPVRVVDATEAAVRPAAARYGDVALVRVAGSTEARAVRGHLRAEAAAAGRDPDSLRVLVSLLVDLGDGEHAAEPGHGGGGPRQTGRGPLYRGGPVDLAELIASWHRDAAVDGFHLVPVEPHRDLERLVNGTVALLQHRGLFRTFYPGGTLREHLDLARPAHQYAGRPSLLGSSDPVPKG
ncbi:LLM class flavin-dependent oxidoreductase [Streptomyces griseoruber]|uniref:FMNH2-dependent monooxygenase n=1 Tax=Streptomyces griseoruber TaxID=1943 RepID=A0A101SNP8_9ACTN|nr:LLM class flavin-dependent oxidoreductase [Streptomyces griseoruber]KUN77226.1 FMNH2-dependent monooxygenase [Streptomyces griseoruber]